jgi:hypothetical protein
MIKVNGLSDKYLNVPKNNISSWNAYNNKINNNTYSSLPLQYAV